MKTRLLCLVLVVLALAVAPVGFAGTDKEPAMSKDPGTSNEPGKASVFGNEDGLSSILCLVDCGNGDRTWGEVETRGGCLDLCESYCGTQCELVN